jgi:hypothetical protein
MADEKISELNGGVTVTPQAGDLFPIARAGANYPVDYADMGGTAVPSDFQPAIVDDYYYFSQIVLPTASDVLEFNAVVAYPFWVSEDTTWTRIGIECATGSGSSTEKIRLGVWANGANNRPGALLLDSGELSLENAGELEATISYLTPANTLVWIGHNCNDTSSLAEVRKAVIARVDSFGWLLGAETILEAVRATQNAYFALIRNVAYGPLPDPFGTPDDLTANAAAIWLRKV